MVRALISVETVNEAHSLGVQQGLGAGTSTPCSSVLTACCGHKKPDAKIADLLLGVFLCVVPVVAPDPGELFESIAYR